MRESWNATNESRRHRTLPLRGTSRRLAFKRVAVGSAGGAWTVRHVLARLAWFPPAADIEPCMRFSRTRLPDVLHRGHSASRSPRPVGSWRDDGSVEVDQPEPVRRLVGDCLPAVSPAALVALGDEPRDAVQRVVVDLVELSG